jgi:protein with PEP-CTERM/exosortase system signal/PEP-CTERM motif-containing protein
MKPLTKCCLVLVVGLCLGFAAAAQANLINITNDLGSPASLVNDYDKGLVGNSGQQTVFNWLSSIVDSYNTWLNPGTDLADPVGSGPGGYNAFVELSNSGGPVDLTGYSYAVLHYGTGPGGIGQGGGFVALFLNDTTGLFTFPSNGSGPNGNGGISWVRLYGPVAVPEAGSTIALLGLALAGIGIARRKLCA